MLHTHEDQVVVVISGQILSHVDCPILVYALAKDRSSRIEYLKLHGRAVLRRAARTDVEFDSVISLFERPPIKHRNHASTEHQDFHLGRQASWPALPIHHAQTRAP